MHQTAHTAQAACRSTLYLNLRAAERAGGQGGERSLLTTAKGRLVLELVGGCSHPMHVPRCRVAFSLPLLLTLSKAAVNGREGFQIYRRKIRSWSLLSAIAALEACILSVTTIRFLRSPGLILSELKGRD